MQLDFPERVEGKLVISWILEHLLSFGISVKLRRKRRVDMLKPFPENEVSCGWIAGISNLLY